MFLFLVSLCGDVIQAIGEDSQNGAFIYIIFYQLLSAAASVAFYSLGLVYMDENTIRNKPTILGKKVYQAYLQRKGQYLWNILSPILYGLVEK